MAWMKSNRDDELQKKHQRIEALRQCSERYARKYEDHQSWIKCRRFTKGFTALLMLIVPVLIAYIGLQKAGDGEFFKAVVIEGQKQLELGLHSMILVGLTGWVLLTMMVYAFKQRKISHFPYEDRITKNGECVKNICKLLLLGGLAVPCAAFLWQETFNQEYLNHNPIEWVAFVYAMQGVVMVSVLTLSMVVLELTTGAMSEQDWLDEFEDQILNTSIPTEAKEKFTALYEKFQMESAVTVQSVQSLGESVSEPTSQAVRRL